MSDIRRNPHNRRSVLNVSHCIGDRAGEISAVLVIEVNTDDIIVPMLHTGEGLGERGEALLVNEDVIILLLYNHVKGMSWRV